VALEVRGGIGRRAEADAELALENAAIKDVLSRKR
jgi:hypothetical protein